VTKIKKKVEKCEKLNITTNAKKRSGIRSLNKSKGGEGEGEGKIITTLEKMKVKKSKN
jgi:hypothetical protein